MVRLTHHLDFGRQRIELTIIKAVTWLNAPLPWNIQWLKPTSLGIRTAMSKWVPGTPKAQVASSQAAWGQEVITERGLPASFHPSNPLPQAGVIFHGLNMGSLEEHGGSVLIVNTAIQQSVQVRGKTSLICTLFRVYLRSSVERNRFTLSDSHQIWSGKAQMGILMWFVTQRCCVCPCA